jgi:hypothetical protein
MINILVYEDYNLTLNEEIFRIHSDIDELERDLENGKVLDIALFSINSLEKYKEILSKTNDFKPFAVAVLKDNSEIEALKEYMDVIEAWILEDQLSRLETLIGSKFHYITLKRKAYKFEQELKSIKIQNDLNIENFTLIKDNINKATVEIAKNFEHNLYTLKSILNEVDDVVYEEYNDVVKDLHEYISILQCEDRIFQMIDGIENSIKAQNEKFEKYRIEIEEEFKASIRHDMIKFYTIQDQRDLALGNEIKDEEEASELTFF